MLTRAISPPTAPAVESPNDAEKASLTPKRVWTMPNYSQHDSFRKTESRPTIIGSDWFTTSHYFTVPRRITRHFLAFPRLNLPRLSRCATIIFPPGFIDDRSRYASQPAK